MLIKDCLKKTCREVHFYRVVGSGIRNELCRRFCWRNVLKCYMTQNLCKVLRKQLIRSFKSTTLGPHLYPIFTSSQGVIYDFYRIEISEQL